MPEFNMLRSVAEAVDSINKAVIAMDPRGTDRADWSAAERHLDVARRGLCSLTAYIKRGESND